MQRPRHKGGKREKCLPSDHKNWGCETPFALSAIRCALVLSHSTAGFCALCLPEDVWGGGAGVGCSADCAAVSPSGTALPRSQAAALSPMLARRALVHSLWLTAGLHGHVEDRLRACTPAPVQAVRPREETGYVPQRGGARTVIGEL